MSIRLKRTATLPPFRTFEKTNTVIREQSANMGLSIAQLLHQIATEWANSHSGEKITTTAQLSQKGK